MKSQQSLGEHHKMRSRVPYIKIDSHRRFELDEVTSGKICLRTEMFRLEEERETAEESPNALPVLQVYIDNIR